MPFLLNANAPAFGEPGGQLFRQGLHLGVIGGNGAVQEHILRYARHGGYPGSRRRSFLPGDGMGERMLGDADNGIRRLHRGGHRCRRFLAGAGALRHYRQDGFRAQEGSGRTHRFS
ncbi:hypothetical protein D3C71_1438610 [compost metagenome]